MEIVLDASAIIAVIADEPESQIVIDYTKNSTIVSPITISYEIANALTRMIKKKVIISEEQIPLITFDTGMAKIGKTLGLKIFGGQNANNWY